MITWFLEIYSKYAEYNEVANNFLLSLFAYINEYVDRVGLPWKHFF